MAGPWSAGKCRHAHQPLRLVVREQAVEGPAVERWAQTVAHEHGFVEAAHTVEIFGTCPDCAGKRLTS